MVFIGGGGGGGTNFLLKTPPPPPPPPPQLYDYKPLIYDVDISKNEKPAAFPIKTFYDIG